ncbi:unnamed protein product [Sphagnum balticum]
MELTKEQKQDLIQQAARKAWEDGGEWGLLAMATGTGKSKCAVDEVRTLMDAEVKPGFLPKILLVVPTEKLRDNNWQDEFNKWGGDECYGWLERYCYASINKVRNQIIDLVILDEAHNLTEYNSTFFTNNSIKRVLALSATPPDPKAGGADVNKVVLFKQFRIKTDFYYPLFQARKDGLVADYEIWAVQTELDDTKKYLEAGPKANRYMQTEQQKYKSLSTMIQKFAIAKNFVMVKMKSLERMRLIGNSMQKLEVCKLLLQRCKGNRILVFGGSIDQIEQLMPGQVYHSKSGKAGHAYLERFMKEEVDELGTVAAANEGINFPNLDIGLIAQISSDSRALVQRIGRCIRHRPNHKSIIFIVISKGTKDMDWFKAASADMDQSIIKYINASNL